MLSRFLSKNSANLSRCPSTLCCGRYGAPIARKTSLLSEVKFERIAQRKAVRRLRRGRDELLDRHRKRFVIDDECVGQFGDRVEFGGRKSIACFRPAEHSHDRKKANTDKPYNRRGVSPLLTEIYPA